LLTWTPLFAILILSGCAAREPTSSGAAKMKKKITEQQAIEITIEEAVRQGAGREDLREMEKRAEDSGGDFYSVSIFPSDRPTSERPNPNFDISARVNKITGEVSDVVVGTIVPPP